jgi:capsular polysaccharide transport system permease protein
MSDTSNEPDNEAESAARLGRSVVQVGKGSTGRELSDEQKSRSKVSVKPAPTLRNAPPFGPQTVEPPFSLVDMRRARKRRFFILLALFVGVPTFCTLLYTILLATPRYVSESQFTYQTFQAQQKLSSGLIQSFVGTSTTNTIDNGAILYEYVRSPALLDVLNAKLDLKGYYSNPKIDYLSRLSANASRERFISYYRRHISVSESLGGYLTVDVYAFDPQYAQALAKAVIEACDSMMDNMTAQARQKRVQLAEAAVTTQEGRVRKARSELTKFQNAHGELDPQLSATQLQQIVANIESQLSAARAELTTALTYMSANAPSVVQLKLKIDALEQQRQHERDRLANTANNSTFSQMLEQYSALQLEETFAKDAYQASLQGLVIARADASSQQSYLVNFAPPGEPYKASLTFPLLYTLTVFLISLLAFGIGSLIAGAFRDQANL